ncbi:MAG: phosphoribosylformimino-5-aminoimidazole carboxamide ribotide isomerase [Kiritimatiellae bacterium]|jgi:phosphoribosylformimino-5-aminoimidazole carboxamide ribotide isomerase|nr:phosphoribosylformimino-5-aminoimidazole carboxamide ribotide isomerase [Kiritimatiellia bacterium]
MTRFRPCIDLHQGQVKQIVGGTLRDGGTAPATNFVSERGADYFAELYRQDGLEGAHVIQLGPGNREAAVSALKAWPDGLQLGGGVTGDTAAEWIRAGAAKVIVTSWLFNEQACLDPERLARLSDSVGPAKLVIDLSCRGANGDWRVAINRWQTPTDLRVDSKTLKLLAPYCSEFLIHAADVEGLRGGMDEKLITFLGAECPLPVTYAGGARSLDDLETVNTLSQGRVDLTIGSALDLFGGDIPYTDCVAWNRQK